MHGIVKRVESLEKGVRIMNAPPVATVIEFNNPAEVEALRAREREALIKQYGTADRTVILCCERIRRRTKAS